MPIIDDFKGQAPSVSGPLDSAEEITPSDSLELPRISRALWIGVAGDVRVTMRSGHVVTFENLPVGWHPIRVRQIWATGTTADSLISCG